MGARRENEQLSQSETSNDRLRCAVRRFVQGLISLSLPTRQDVNAVWSFQHPQLYVPGQLNLYFSKKAFFKCALHSIYSSMVLFFIPYAAMHDTVRDDGMDVADYQSFALTTQTCLLFAVTIQVPGTLILSFVFVRLKNKKNYTYFLFSLRVYSWGWRCLTGQQ